jgi:hypothetical protein
MEDLKRERNKDGLDLKFMPEGPRENSWATSTGQYEEPYFLKQNLSQIEPSYNLSTTLSLIPQARTHWSPAERSYIHNTTLSLMSQADTHLSQAEQSYNHSTTLSLTPQASTYLSIAEPSQSLWQQILLEIFDAKANNDMKTSEPEGSSTAPNSVPQYHAHLEAPKLEANNLSSSPAAQYHDRSSQAISPSPYDLPVRIQAMDEGDD